VTLLGPDAFRQYIAKELKKWGDVTKAAGIKPE
jgi:tripartite-type tricarboxylate transporter receptor subunit TctC